MSSRLKLAGICFAAAFVLAACGGGGGSPLDTARSDLTQAQADLAAAQAAQAAAEARATAAEADKAAAETAQAAAEARATAAETAQAAAEARATAAETAQAAAEAAQRAAEAAQATAEAAQRAAAEGTEQARRDAEAAAEAQRMAEEARDAAQMRANDAETAKTDAENRATQAETDRMAAENRATQAEAERDAAQEALRQAEMKAQQAADEAMRKAAVAQAKKLHTGIYAPAADNTGTNVGDVHAAYNNADTPNSGDAADTFIMVTTGDGTAVNSQALSEDKDTMVAALHGWTGKRYTASGTDVAGTYEAYVYSHVGPAMEGDPFNEEYTLTDGETGDITALTGYTTGRVASPRFTQTAGTMTFDLAENLERLAIPGMYHGVSGTYYCTPTAISTDRDTCSATVAARGFTLGGGTWSFKPGTATAKVTSVPDASYASYGWWLHTAANGDLTASAFVDRKGAAEAASGITALSGSATYAGGAVGKYALTSSTGGTNEAGHFTADVELNANFNDDMISGTIDNFMDGDGNSKDWSVALKETAVGDDGAITASTTTWTIGGNAADADGSWTGSLQENGDDNVPGIATGTFYSTYGTDGKMVGAFGANKQ